MRLKNLIKDFEPIDIKGSIKIDIKGIAYNSALVKHDYIFVAIEGLRVDGHQFIYSAISKGAKAIVVSKDIDTPEEITVVKVNDTRAALSTLSATFYGYPSKNLELIGITGTNGKTTTAYFIKSVLDASRRNTSLIGTVETVINGKSSCSSHTTPESLELQGLFKTMLKENVEACIMEVSSHSLQLSRVNDCDFNIGIFTNLTHEHLDFHGTMENYFNVKKQLFYQTNDFNIVNIDDSYGKRLVKEIANNGPKLLTYGTNTHANILARDIFLGEGYTECTISTPQQKTKVKIKIPGRYNLYNSLAAVACGYALNMDLEDIKEGLEAVTSIPGRFELIPTGKNLNIIIDYAHTPDGFEQILDTIDNFAKGRTIIVFGCVGERDHSKRRKMGYQVRAHFIFNPYRPDMAYDRNEHKHHNILKRSLKAGGRRDIFLGTRECQGYVEPCVFGEETGFYDSYGELHLGTMVHGINYPDETGRNEMEVRLWNPVMKDGVIKFIRPDECSQIRKINDMDMKHFDYNNVESADDLHDRLERG